MSTENTSSAASQGGNPVPRIEQRGENDFASLLESQGGGQNNQNGQQSSTTPPAKSNVPSKPLTETTGVEPSEGAQGTTAAAQAGGTATPPAVPHAKSDLDVSAIVRATVEGMSQQQQRGQQSQQEERPLTTQEFNAKYGIPTIDAAYMQRILDADPAKGAVALQSLIIQAVRSGALISKDLYTADLQKFRGEVDPHIKYLETRQAAEREAALKNEFYSLHTDLKGEEPLVEELTAAMVARVQSGQLKVSSKEEGFKLVADAARKIVARMNKPGSAGTQGGNAQASTTPPARQMSAASSAGRSGTGQQQPKSDVELVFGADAR